METIQISHQIDPEVVTAVEFLCNLYQKDYKEQVLKRYLTHKRGLSEEQVDAAFKIYHLRTKMEEVKESSLSQHSESTKGLRKSCEKWTNKDAAPETQVFWKALSYLLPHRQAEGVALFKSFLAAEREYCTILECLQNEWYPELTVMADGWRFDMTRKEVNLIFERIPEMLRFHKVFYEDLNNGFSIGGMFVGLLNFFKSYADYLRGCLETTLTMRAHVHDKRLYSCMAKVKKQSSRKWDDLSDLLLVPLGRICDYKIFLSKLFEWANSTKKAEYDVLGKAMRRIGRIADHVDKYRHDILNQCEMNKIQTFMGKQCDILSPHRRLVRRGILFRRKVGWAGKKRTYIFFLFNDCLLWANQKGELQNLVQLRMCEVFPSTEKIDKNRKFSIVVRNPRPKTILLESITIRQKTAWYRALERTISAVHELSEEAWKSEVPRFEEKTSDEEDKADLHLDDDATSPGSEIGASLGEVFPDESDFEHDIDLSNQPKEIEPLEDAVSVISDSDFSQYEKFWNSQKVGTNDTLAPISPFLKRYRDKSSDHGMSEKDRPSESRDNNELEIPEIWSRDSINTDRALSKEVLQKDSKINNSRSQIDIELGPQQPRFEIVRCNYSERMLTKKKKRELESLGCDIIYLNDYRS